MNDKTLCKLDCNGTGYYLLTVAHDDGTEGFDLTLCDGNKAWCAMGRYNLLYTCTCKMNVLCSGLK